MKTTTFSLLFLLSMTPMATAQAQSAAARPATPAAPATNDESSVRPDCRIVPGDKLRIDDVVAGYLR
jgi:hypothetical protein